MTANLSKTEDHFEAAQPFIKNLSNSQVWITIAIVNYNSGDWLRRCVQALSNQINQNFRVVIVDNASTDGSLELIPELDERFSLLRLENNIGFAAANNLVCLNATTMWVATLNPDALPSSDWLSEILSATERHRDVAMFGSTQISEGDRGVLDGVGDAYSFLGLPWRGNYNHSLAEIPEEGYVFSPCAAAAVYRSDAFKQAGGFDEPFFCYCEDVDIGFRLRLLGYECVQVVDAKVYHGGSASSGARSDFTIYHSYRNRLWTFVKNVPFPLMVVLLIPHLTAVGFLLVREIVVGKKFKPAWAGLRDGIRNLKSVWALRSRVQDMRKSSVFSIARAMNWSPLKMMRRDHDVRPLRKKKP
jgi:N-acetylglucosaminyl-diphospho-decaprenol L-rhamnosyltransferase